MRVFSAYIWHSEGWTPRNEPLMEAVLKRARNANMSPVDFEKSFGFGKTRRMWWPGEGFYVQVKKCEGRMGRKGK